MIYPITPEDWRAYSAANPGCKIYRGVPEARQDQFPKARIGVVQPRGGDTGTKEMWAREAYIRGEPLAAGFTAWTPRLEVAQARAGFDGIVLEMPLASVLDRILTRPVLANGNYTSEMELFVTGTFFGLKRAGSEYKFTY